MTCFAAPAQTQEAGQLRFGDNTEPIAKNKLKVPQTGADQLRLALKGEIQVTHPASSGTAHTMVATLVQLMGETKPLTA